MYSTYIVIQVCITRSLCGAPPPLPLPCHPLSHPLACPTVQTNAPAWGRHLQQCCGSGAPDREGGGRERRGRGATASLLPVLTDHEGVCARDKRSREGLCVCVCVCECCMCLYLPKIPHLRISHAVRASDGYSPSLAPRHAVSLDAPHTPSGRIHTRCAMHAWLFSRP